MNATWKWGLIGAGLLAAGGLGFWLYHSIYTSGLAAGRAEVQASWDKDKQSIATLAAAAKDEAVVKEAEAKAANLGVIHELQAKLDASSAAGNDLARRLHNALARPATSGSTMPQAAGGSSPPATSGVPPSQDAVVTSVATYDAACQRDAARLNALIEEVSSQLPKETMK